MARPRRQFSAAEHERILALWADGDSAASIATELGSARATLVRVLREAGVTVERRRWARHGADHHLWRGGRVRAHGGYVAVHVLADSPFASMGHRRHRDSNSSAVYVLEHRLVMAEAVGRPLEPHETVHHLNGVKDDNRRENLQLRNGRHGKGVVLACLDCGSTNVGSRPIH